MRAPGRTSFALLVLGVLAVALPSLVLAATSAEIQSLTEGSPYLQSCADQPTDVLCTGPTSRVYVWTARITPITGPVTDLFTGSVLYVANPLDAASRQWMTALHAAACGNTKSIQAFIDQVAVLKAGSGVGPQAIGICTISGDMVINSLGRQSYRVTSNIKPVPTVLPTATGRPTDTPTPTAKPTLKPTAKPTLKPTPTVAPTATPTPSPSIAPS